MKNLTTTAQASILLFLVFALNSGLFAQGNATSSNIHSDSGSASDAPFQVSIEQKRKAIQGMTVWVNVTLNQAASPISGFELLMAYDRRAIRYEYAWQGPTLYDEGCKWEYFSCKQVDVQGCGGICPYGTVRASGLAEHHEDTDHPNCLLPELPAILFTMEFLVSDNRTFECATLPITFIWTDCGDNTLWLDGSDTLFLSRNIYDMEGANLVEIDSIKQIRRGAESCDTVDSNRPVAQRAVDFHNGGIELLCDWFVDPRGDLNLNEIANEVADLALFADYFLQGSGVFTINSHGQSAASDVNQDGKTLTLADLVFLTRVVIGEANPYPKRAPEPIQAAYSLTDGVISVDSAMAAASIVIAGNAAPVLLAETMDMRTHFDGKNTHILIYTKLSKETERPVIKTFSGPLIRIPTKLLSLEFASPLGGMVELTPPPPDQQ